MPAFVVRVKRTAIVVAAVVAAFVTGRANWSGFALVAQFAGFAWLWDRFAQDWEDLDSRIADQDDQDEADRLTLGGSPKSNRQYSVGANSVSTVVLPNDLVQTQITESVQWLNVAIARTWAVAQPFVSRIAREAIDKALAATVPPVLKSIKLGG